MKAFSFSLLLFFTLQLSAQTGLQVYFGQLNSSLDQWSQQEQEQLYQALSSSFVNHQVYLADDTSLPLVVHSSLVSLGSENYEGLSNRTIISTQLGLELKHQASGLLIDAVQINLSGSGTSQVAAVRQAISQISGRQANLKVWLRGLPKKIESFYQNNCGYLLQNAQKAMDAQDYGQAFALVNGLPHTAPCAAEATALSETAYQSFQKQACKQQIQAAEFALLQGKPNDAVDHLAQIDPQASCATEAKNLLEQAATALEKQRSDKAAFLRKVYNNQVKIEEARAQTKKAILESNTGG